ncbi:helix-turn-helix domain-containing protein [Halalkalibacter urbisdiaboli]|uniref:helix-turn-helix domain-containing protein n=1 Tax=Halalkalibacter urbisdiaboli TaxID=1960589 RepID=UPI0024782AFC|nr:helix-turn-helix domain-containing protein [Halalkalibacter urbisdiaboli]
MRIAKIKGKYKGGKKKYHANARGKDKVIYDEVVRLLSKKESVMDIHRKTGLSRNTIYAIKKDLN